MAISRGLRILEEAWVLLEGALGVGFILPGCSFQEGMHCGAGPTQGGHGRARLVLWTCWQDRHAVPCWPLVKNNDKKCTA